MRISDWSSDVCSSDLTRGLPISGNGGITTWRDAAEFMALGAGNVQVCTAAMTYGFKIVQEMIEGLTGSMDAKGQAGLHAFTGRAAPNVTDWQSLHQNSLHHATTHQPTGRPPQRK